MYFLITPAVLFRKSIKNEVKISLQHRHFNVSNKVLHESPQCRHGRINHVADAAYAAGLVLYHAHFYENTPIFYWDMPILGALRI